MDHIEEAKPAAPKPAYTEEFEIEDFSTNGTYLNGEKVGTLLL